MLLILAIDEVEKKHIKGNFFEETYQSSLAVMRPWLTK